MTTPAFNPIETLLNSIRYYTQFDPYYYTVDNRPLEDLANNVGILTRGINAARLSALTSSFNNDLEVSCKNGIASNFQVGLIPTKINSTSVKIGIGGVFIPTSVASNISQVLLKKAILQRETTLSLQGLPTVVGTSKVYVVECQYVDITASTDPDTYFFDASNASLFDSCLDGVLSLQVNSSANAFTTGTTEVLPTTTAGWIPLYCITVRQTGEWDRLYAHPSSPSLLKGAGLKEDLNLRLPATGAASSVATLDPLPAFQFTEGADSSVIASINLDSKDVNRYKDVSFNLSYTSSTINGNYAIIASYAVVSALDIVTPISFTTNAVESLPAPSVAYSLVSNTLSGKVPGNVLQGAKQLIVKITRTGTNEVVDTATGSLLLVSASITQ